MESNKIYCGDCLEVMPNILNDFIDLTVTSPPYDNLRNYKGYVFNFEGIAKELYRVTKQGGVVVWVVSDETINGSETGTSFKQVLYFKEIGFNLHDTMIWYKDWGSSGNRYYQKFEYMFVLSKGKLLIFNPIEDVENTGMNKKRERKDLQFHFRNKDGELVYGEKGRIRDYRKRDNIWFCGVGNNKSTKDKIAFKHPAIFPEQLAQDHIISWSNEGDIILDPMCGSGTTCKMAKKLGRRYIGIDISKEYCEIAENRLRAIPESLFESI